MKKATFALVVFFIYASAAAQETRARMTGTVVDGQGALVPGVSVTALNSATNVSIEAVTNASGVYTMQRLVPGP